MYFRPLVIFMFLFLPLLFRCSGDQKVKIAIITRLETGSVVGVSEVNAAKMFIEDRGINNIEIVPFDDGWEPAKTVKAYEAVRRRGIDIIITGHTSSCAIAISDRVNMDKVLLFETGATTDQLSDKDDYIIRNIPDVHQEQKSIAGYIKSRHFSPLLVIRDTENLAYTEPALIYFRNYYTAGQMSVLDINISNFNIARLEAGIRKQKFDAAYLLIGSYKTAAGAIAQLIIKVNPSATVIYTPWVKTPAIIETAGGSIHNSVFPSIYRERYLAAGIDSFFMKYRERYRETPTFMAINVYSALQVLHAAISSGHRDPDSIKEFILNSGTIQTDFGPVTFNRYGDAVSDLYFITDIKREFR